MDERPLLSVSVLNYNVCFTILFHLATTMVDISVICPKMFPKSKIREFNPYWDACFSYANINTDDRLRMFISQCAHECASFTRFEENLNYSSDGLANTWPNRYALKINGVYVKTNGRYTPNDLAKNLHRKPVEIANLTYANRMGNGSHSTGDGYRYRGRGIKMNTGKSQYRQLTQALWPLVGVDFVENPDALSMPECALWGSVWYWKVNRLNNHADMGYKGILGATKAINGGTIGLKKRTEMYEYVSGFI